ncbi:hypothetical protein ACIBM4_29415 [Streptomyces sp. NPDC050256]|uniref:hypothetical protein n=1 Tax=Streptomyces sp. NPDC050256 TaxID=3365607 RepID=UPI003796B103
MPVSYCPTPVSYRAMPISYRAMPISYRWMNDAGGAPPTYRAYAARVAHRDKNYRPPSRK